MRCRNCDTPNPDTHRYCSSCGTKLGDCEHCGFENSPEASFCGGCGRALGTPATSPPQTSKPVERRHTTILFCDVIGSTALSTALDPEDLRALIVQYHALVGEVIEKNDGYVAQYLGDGILAYFGYPTAQEDDAERAVRAGLELIEAVANSDSSYEIRVGIASGMIVVGDLDGDADSDREPAIGSTPNLAARLQEVAQAGWVVISPTTRNLVGDQFEHEDLGLHELKGFAEPVQLWRALAENAGVSRFDAAHARLEVSPLIGRDSELANVMDCWDQAKAGNGQVVCIQGEPGLGKSRLMLALTTTLANEQHSTLNYQCGPHFRNTALFPIISQIERSAGFARGDSEEDKLDKLEALLARTGADNVGASVRYIAALTSILFVDRYAPIEESVGRQKEQTLNTLVAQISALAADRPLMVLFEDAHWIDPTTLELLVKVVAEVVNLRVLVLITSRPEFTPPWQEVAHATTILLRPLAESEGVGLIDDVAGAIALPERIKRSILDKSDGNPLFIEELTRTVVESESVGSQLAPSAVPESLQDSLNERLDRHSSNKGVAQIAAVIGRDFTSELLAAVTHIPPAELGIILERLIDANIIQRTAISGEHSYRFKHALVQDAAYESILLNERPALNQRVAIALETEFPEILEKQPETFARHLAAAGDKQRAIEYWQQAGERADERAAHAEAADHYLKALGLLEGLPETVERHGLELGLRGHYGFSLSASQGYAVPEVESAQLRALELCELIGDPETVFAVKRRLCTFFIVRCELGRAGELAHQCIELGHSRQRNDYLIEGYNALGYVHAYRGEFADAVEALERTILLYRTAGGGNFAYPTEQNPLLAALTLMAQVSCIRGDFKKALACVDESIDLANSLNKPFDLAYAENFYAAIEHIQGLPEDGRAHGRLAAEISEHHGFAHWLCIASIYAVFSNRDERGAEHAIDVINHNLAIHEFSGARLFLSFLLGCLAKSYLLAGRHNEASATLQTALDHVDSFQERIYEPGLYQLRGELHVAMGLTDKARQSFNHAIELARAQGAKLLELQALIALLKLEQAHGGTTDETGTSLAQLLEDFVHRGETSPDLDEAQRLLTADAAT